MPSTISLERPEDTEVPDEVKYVEGKFVGMKLHEDLSHTCSKSLIRVYLYKPKIK